MHLAVEDEGPVVRPGESCRGPHPVRLVLVHLKSPSCHVMYSHVMSCHVESFHVESFHVESWHVM